MVQIEALLGSESKQWQTVAWQVKEVRKTFGPETPLGKRRTGFADAPDHDVEDIQQSMIEREPITVVVSEKGWIRALKGHVTDTSTLTFKTDDSLKLALHAETTDKLLVFSTGGKFYTLGADKLPGGRGHGEPIRLMVDMDNAQDIVTVFVHKPGRKLLLASTDGRGFIVPETEVIANTRKGKQVLNVDGTEEARICVEAGGDFVAIIGQNRKFLIFPAEQLPEMTRGKGVRLQRYKDGGPSDVRTFSAADGLTWMDSSGRSYTRTAEELKPWVAERGQAGRLPPDKFPKTNSFGTPQLR
jgi:topoisomerase-4 subunit A